MPSEGKTVAAFLISYDLNVPGQNYDALFKTIKGLGAWWHYLDSTWIVDSSLSVQQVSDNLTKVIDKSDNLLVIDISGDSYQGWLSKDAWDWIKKHV